MLEPPQRISRLVRSLGQKPFADQPTRTSSHFGGEAEKRPLSRKWRPSARSIGGRGGGPASTTSVCERAVGLRNGAAPLWLCLGRGPAGFEPSISAASLRDQVRGLLSHFSHSFHLVSVPATST